jgi:DNA processing protein
MSELYYRVALTKVRGIGAITARQLVTRAGSAEDVFRMSKAGLLKITGQAVVKELFAQRHVLTWAEKELNFIAQQNIKVYFFDQPDYPQHLLALKDAPFVLYVRGNVDFNPEKIIGIVGTRSPTHHGLHACENIVEGLLKYNPVIISGLAYGIDITAHRKAVEVGLATTAVMGSGLQRVYPSEHTDFTKKMLATGGLITEYPSDQDPDREHFPQRNRIIAGLCDALVVIESARKGGSMISAQYAHDYNKEVFAVPGRLTDKLSSGCNYLIKTHKAVIIETAADIAYLLGWETAKPLQSIVQTPKKPVQPPLFTSHLTDLEKQILEKLLELVNCSTTQLAAALLSLELAGFIQPLVGKRVAKT